jgi:quercetin dioxygenase-like cupin family protein
MHVMRPGDTPDEPFDGEHFSGSVTRRDLATLDHPSGTALLVSFPPGARTHWHSHPDGQVLHIVEGRGRVGTRDGHVEEVTSGDLVVAAPHEEHWHGAAEDAAVRHLALSFGETRWLEPVEDV